MKRLVLFALLLIGVVAPAHPHSSIGVARRHQAVARYVPPNVIPPDLVAYWSYNASSAVDDTGNGHVGTTTNVTFGTPAKLGGVAAQFPGSGSNKIAFTTIPLGAAAWSIQAWIDPHINPGSGFALVMGVSGSSFGLYWRGGGVFDFFATGGNHVFTTTQALDTYGHVVVAQAANGDLKEYFNGVLIQTYFLASENFSPNTIGFDGATSAYNGAFDEVAIWNRELTLADVQFLYNSGAGVPLGTPGFP